MTRPYPDYSFNERLADGIVHVVGLVFGITALTILLFYTVYDHPSFTTMMVLVYGVAMVLMFACSAAYHMVPVLGLKELLRRVDQSAIFLKIAGTYTPFAALKLGGFWGYGLLGTVWAVAFFGIGLLILQARQTNLMVFLYLALGWLGILVVWPLFASLSSAVLTLIVTGGVLYSAGTIFHAWHSLPFSNAIWHVFVLAATVCHYFAVFVSVVIDR
ncbi:MAG: hemolysin III family protein [Pseudomonadota bacterium]